MNSSEKAKQKLMESMRMVGAGSGETIKGVDKKQDIATQYHEPDKKKKKVSARKVVPTSTQKSAVDSYQMMRRIWPD